MTLKQLKKMIGKQIDGIEIKQSRNCIRPAGTYPCCKCDTLKLIIGVIRIVEQKKGNIVSIGVCKKGYPLAVEIEKDIS